MSDQELVAELAHWTQYGYIESAHAIIFKLWGTCGK